MTNEIAQQKAALRTEIRIRRDSLSKQAVDDRSRRILSHLKGIPELKSARAVHTYVAWKNEVDTHALIRWLFDTGRRVIVPWVEKADRRMHHFEIRSLAELQPGSFGILEPVREMTTEVDTTEIDMVIVPGLAFDLSGNRLGYGWGFYDDFLKDLSIPKVALAYDFQVIDSVPVNNNDVPLDIVVSETRVIETI